MAKPTTEQLVLINQKALVPLTEDQVHSFTAKVIGTNRIDKYLMMITPNFLSKMADQAKQGVALLIDHPWMQWSGMSIPYGRTFDSKIVQEGTELALYADHYMIKGQEINDISTDDLAAGIDGGTIFDTSAGFVTTDHICNVCNNDYYNNSDGPACTHFRGNMYDGKECLVLADDGYLMENSLVFDGGYDGAGIIKNSLSRSKTENASQEIQLKPLALDAKSLSGDGSIFYFFSKKSGLTAYVQDGKPNEQAKALAEGDGKTMAMTEEEKQALQQAQNSLTLSNGLLTQIRTALGSAGDDGILAKLTALSSQATDGVAYKTKITETACGAGVRAMGDAFNVEAMKLSLANLPVAEIEKIAASYELQAKVVLGAGGRKTEGADTNLPANALTGAPGNPQDTGGAKTVEQLQALAKTEARDALKNTGNEHLMKEVK